MQRHVSRGSTSEFEKFTQEPNSVYIQSMILTNQVQPVSYLKANAAEIMRNMANDHKPMVITQNGKATAVLQDLASFEQTQETMALLKILALGNAQIEAGRVTSAKEAFAQVRRSRQTKSPAKA